MSVIIPKYNFKSKKQKLYIPAAEDGGDNSAFFTLEKLKNKY